MKTLTLSEAFEQATKGPLAASGEYICAKPASDTRSEVVASTFGYQNTRKNTANAALLAHCFNHMQEAAQALSNLLNTIENTPDEWLTDQCEGFKLDEARTALAKLNQVQIP